MARGSCTTHSMSSAGRCSSPTRRRSQGAGAAGRKTDKIDAQVLAVLSQRDLVPAIWLPDPSIRRERELARYRLCTTAPTDRPAEDRARWLQLALRAITTRTP